MANPDTGLPSDNIGGDLDPATRSAYTSPTNIGAYLWATVVARDTGLIGAAEARHRMRQTIHTVAGLEQHEPSGMFYNWYDPATGAKLTTWPENGNPVYPFASSVDNGWLATGLLVAARADKQGRPRRRPDPRGDGLRLLLQPRRGRPEGPGRHLHPGRRPDPRRLLGRAAGRRHLQHPGQLRRRPGRGRLLHLPPLRRLQHRAADGVLPGHRGRPDPPAPLLRHRAHLPGHLRLVVDRDQADRRVAPVPRHRRLRGHPPLPRPEGGPDLGRQHVRGADGAAVRARGDVGQAVLGRQPPALRAGPDRARPRRGRLRLLGLLALQQPGRRLPGVRRRRARHGRSRLHLRPGADRLGPALRGLPRPSRASPRRRRTATAW